MAKLKLIKASQVFQLTALATALALTGCGGGGTVDAIAPAPDGSTVGGNGGTGGSGSTAKLRVSDITLGSGAKVTDAGTTVQALVVDNANKPVKGAVVTFNGGGVDFEGNAKEFTDENGIAKMSIKPSNGVVNGIYQLVATAEYKGETVNSETLSFEVESTGQAVGDPVNVSAINLELDSSGALPATGGKATVKVTDENGEAISGTLVTFAVSDEQKISLSSSNSAVRTNTDGEASIVLTPTLSADTGSYSVTATAEFNGKSDSTNPVYFTLSSLGLQLTDLKASPSSIEAGESSLITLITKDSSANVQNGVVVNFTATCGTFSENSVESASQGNVSTTYNAVDAQGNLCEGKQTIIATTSNGVTQTIDVNVAAIVSDSVRYTSGEITLGVKGSGSSNTGKIEFTVYSNGTPVGSQDVRISKVYAPEDMSFVTLNNQTPQIVESNSEGVVSVNLYPGYKSGPVEIKAELLDESGNVQATALSKDVSIATGRATQESFSVSVSKNVLDNSVDGDEATVTARLADRMGNSVPDGTVVSFMTEGGKITSNCSTVNGVCTATLSTQNPRTDGRYAVVAYLEGNKQYTDINGNNFFDAGDILTQNIGDFFRDDNENGEYDSDIGERIYRRNAGTEACAFSTFSQPTVPNTCNQELEAVLRQEILMGFASSTPYLADFSGQINAERNVFEGVGSFKFFVFGRGDGTLPMPSGTTFSVNVKDNTNYSPVAVLSINDDGNKFVQISGAPADSAISFTLDGATFTEKTDNSGIAVKVVDNSLTGTPVVADVNETCEAEMVGDEVVADIFPLGAGTGTINPKNVAYAINYKGCQATDAIQFVVDAPSNSSKYRFDIVKKP